MPPRLYAAWKPSMMLRPYARCRLTPSMFMDASRAPTHIPNTASDTASCHSALPAPAPSSARHTTGCTQRSTTLGRTRFTRCSVATLPTPASTGTAARNAGSSASLTPYRSCSAGIRVTSSAKTAPCAKKPTANEARP